MFLLKHVPEYLVNTTLNKSKDHSFESTYYKSTYLNPVFLTLILAHHILSAATKDC
jgi:hypothetical protein